MYRITSTVSGRTVTADDLRDGLTTILGSGAEESAEMMAVIEQLVRADAQGKALAAAENHLNLTVERIE